MSFWIFKCDPKRYRLADRLLVSFTESTWRVTRYKDKIAPGDTAFIMETGSKRAIRAVMQIDTAPQEMAELEAEQAYWIERDAEARCRVRGRLKPCAALSITELRSIDALKNLSIFKGFQQATNFPVSDSEGRTIQALLNSKQGA